MQGATAIPIWNVCSDLTRTISYRCGLQLSKIRYTSVCLSVCLDWKKHLLLSSRRWGACQALCCKSVSVSVLLVMGWRLQRGTDEEAQRRLKCWGVSSGDRWAASAQRRCRCPGLQPEGAALVLQECVNSVHAQFIFLLLFVVSFLSSSTLCCSGGWYCPWMMFLSVHLLDHRKVP